MKTILFSLICFIFLNACSESGPAEQTGERIDEIADNVKEGEAPLKKKGVMEKTGEAVDDALN